MLNSLRKRLSFSDNKYFYLLILFMLISITTMMLPAWLEGKFFLGGGDIKTQWDPFYYLNRQETISALKDGKLPFYSWILFLGTNLWSSKASYGLFDIYNLFTYPFHTDYLHVYLVLCYLKMLVAAMLCYVYLEYIGIRKEYCMLGGLCFGMSSFGVYFTSEFGFLSFYSLLPLYFLGIEMFLKERKRIPFIISVILLFLTNYYLFFSITLLSPVYFIYRCVNIRREFKTMVLNALEMVGLYLIGFLICGVMILPVFSFITQNQRVGAGGLVYTYNNLKIYLHLLTASLIPNQTYIFGNNVYTFDNHNLKELCFFSSSCVTLLIPQAFCDTDKRFRFSTVVLFLVTGLFMYLPFMASALNGFSEPSFRFSMFCIFINILVFVSVLDRNKHLNTKLLIVTFVAEAIVIYACFFGVAAVENLEISSYKKQLAWISVCCLFLLVYSVLLSRGLRHVVKYIMLVEVSLYAISFGYRVKGTDLVSYEYARSVLNDYRSYETVKDYLDGLEEENRKSFYRTYVPYGSLYWYTTRNMNIYYDLPGVMTYDSTYEPSFDGFRYLGNIPTVQDIDWEFSVEDPDLLDFLNVKYALALSEDEIPFNSYSIVQSDYRWSIIIAENNNYVSLGRTCSGLISKESYDGDPKKLMDNIISDDPEIADMLDRTPGNEAEMHDIYYDHNHMEGVIDCPESTVMLMTIPYDEGWKVLVNGEEVKTYNINRGFLGIPVQKGRNTVDMYFIPPGFKTGAVLTAIGSAMFLVVLFAEIRRSHKTGL